MERICTRLSFSILAFSLCCTRRQEADTRSALALELLLLMKLKSAGEADGQTCPSLLLGEKELCVDVLCEHSPKSVSAQQGLKQCLLTGLDLSRARNYGVVELATHLQYQS